MKNLFLAALVAVGLFVGCDNSKSGSSSSSSLKIEITDAPFPFEAIAQANVIVSGVSVVGSGGVTPVDSNTHAYDLVQLQHGNTAIMTSLELAPGTYHEVRIIVESATVTLTDGRSFSLQAPSGSSSGIKVKLKEPLEIVTGLSERLILDFDLAASFSPIPNSAKHVGDINTFRFHPVVRGVVAANTGEIAGTVVSAVDGTPIAGATITVENLAGDFSQTITTQEDGSFVAAFLYPDTYVVSVETADGLTATSENLAVALGNRVETTLAP
jgi:hypothetical protein